MNLRLLVMVLFSIRVLPDPILISEIYGNAVGPGMDRGREWIEIANTTGEPIYIDELSFELFDNQSLEVFKENIHPRRAISFNGRLLIAQHPDLGLDRDLHDDIPLVVIQGFNIRNRKEQRLCVTINKQFNTCSSISKRVKILDGVSLFRDLDDLNEFPLWRPEPCHLKDRVFATPGLAARACVEGPEIKNRVFRAGSRAEMVFTSNLDSISDQTTPIPEVLKAEWSHASQGHIRVSIVFIDSDMKGSYLLTLCRAAGDGFLLCQSLGTRPMVILSNAISVDFPSVLRMTSSRYFVRIEGIDGTRTTIWLKNGEERIFAEKARNAHVRWEPNMDDGKSEILLLDVSSEEVPLNVSIIDRNHNVWWQRSFIHAKSHPIPLPKDLLAVSLKLRREGPDGFFKDMALFSPSSEPSLPPGCQSGGWFPWWMLLMVWVSLFGYRHILRD